MLRFAQCMGVARRNVINKEQTVVERKQLGDQVCDSFNARHHFWSSFYSRGFVHPICPPCKRKHGLFTTHLLPPCPHRSAFAAYINRLYLYAGRDTEDSHCAMLYMGSWILMS